MFSKKNKELKNKVKNLTIYIVLRISVILILILQIFNKNFENVFMCILTLILFTIPLFINKKFKIELPDVLEGIILLFIFSAEILGNVQNFYGIFKSWDTMLHTINGFLCAAIGFSLIDILNRNPNVHMKLTPIFVALVAFCFSMTIGVLWEFFEFGMDKYLLKDMQKDRIISDISSVNFNEEETNRTSILKDVYKTEIYSLKDGKNIVTTIDGGYLDIGINDTMKDLFVNFIGAIIFSIIGILYIKDRDGYKFAENFIPKSRE